VRWVAVADAAHDLADRQLVLAQQLRRRGHPSCDEFFMEAAVTELRIGAL
jgi:hypothetical protein